MFKIDLNMKLLSPLTHFGDQRMGTMQIMRTQKFIVNNEVMDIPIYSGNAFRGILRRIGMRKYLDVLGITEEGISAKLYYMLFSGGALTGGSRYVEIGDKKIMREMCPLLSLFGTAIGDQIPQGKMKVGIFKPLCEELNDYMNLKSEISIKSMLSFYDLLEDTFYTRRDDLKSVDFNIIDDTKHNNAVQMKYEMQCLSIGTELLADIRIENANELEKSCLIALLEQFKEQPFIGGKSSIGHGEVFLNYNSEISSDLYYNYLKENKESIVKWIRDMEGILK